MVQVASYRRVFKKRGGFQVIFSSSRVTSQARVSAQRLHHCASRKTHQQWVAQGFSLMKNHSIDEFDPYKSFTHAQVFVSGRYLIELFPFFQQADTFYDIEYWAGEITSCSSYVCY